ncbi:hypothetical protein AAG906_030928 [Vitis piasezkii]
MSKTMHSTYGKRRELGNDNGGKESSSICNVSHAVGCDENNIETTKKANVKLKSFRDMKKPPRALLSLIGIILFLRSFCFHTRLPLPLLVIQKLSNKGSQTTNLIQEPESELMLVCWVFMDNVMP